MSLTWNKKQNDGDERSTMKLQMKHSQHFRISGCLATSLQSNARLLLLIAKKFSLNHFWCSKCLTLKAKSFETNCLNELRKLKMNSSSDTAQPFFGLLICTVDVRRVMWWKNIPDEMFGKHNQSWKCEKFAMKGKEENEEKIHEFSQYHEKHFGCDDRSKKMVKMPSSSKCLSKRLDFGRRGRPESIWRMDAQIESKVKEKARKRRDANRMAKALKIGKAKQRRSNDIHTQRSTRTGSGAVIVTSRALLQTLANRSRRESVADRKRR